MHIEISLTFHSNLVKTSKTNSISVWILRRQLERSFAGLVRKKKTLKIKLIFLKNNTTHSEFELCKIFGVVFHVAFSGQTNSLASWSACSLRAKNAVYIGFGVVAQNDNTGHEHTYPCTRRNIRV